MAKVTNFLEVLAFCAAIFLTVKGHASERSLESDVDARSEYNSNIFLASGPHDPVSGLIITPSLSGVIKENNWEGTLRARLRINRYSDKNLNANDQLFDLTGRYVAERDIFSLNLKHDLTSNLNITSSDFGLVGRRINTKDQSVTPQYTRLLTERSVLVLSYAYSDVDFLEAVNTGFTPYVSQTGSGSVIYDMTEKDKLTVSLTAVDYSSRNDLITYRLYMSRFGIKHEFSETLSADYTVGVSRRKTTNRQTRSYDFFGRPVILTQEIDSNTRGFVLDVNVTKKLETGQIEGRLSRDNTTNSFGGLDQADKFNFNFSDKLSSLWSYDIKTRYENITALSSGARSTDRNVLFLEMRAFYSIATNWQANASYRYVQRKFKSNINNDKAPYSNRIYAGLTYNFPSLSTF